MWNSFLIAFSTYSKLPLPKAEWREEHMKYSMVCFPFVGAVLGLLWLLVFHGLCWLGAGTILRGACLTALPVLVTGGIHMDGFLDTVDAKSSWKSREEKLAILKDPHIGAFAVIYGVVYAVLQLGLYCEVGKEEAAFIALGFVYSRILSGMAVLTLKKAKKEGMVADTASAAQKRAVGLLAGELFICCFMFLSLNAVAGGICIVFGAAVFFYYRYMAYRVFGGITGDLAGWFLQVCELVLGAAAVLSGKI